MELVYSLTMMRDGFLAANRNLDEVTVHAIAGAAITRAGGQRRQREQADRHQAGSKGSGTGEHDQPPVLRMPRGVASGVNLKQPNPGRMTARLRLVTGCYKGILAQRQ
jgi:hypothetical protein